jgi:mRNA interferase RelE/StbE
MAYQIIISRSAKKQIEKLNNVFQTKIRFTLTQLAIDPFAGKKLKGEYSDLWSYRVWPYRILYKIQKHELTVWIIKVGHHQGIYD